ncbi:3-hydroxylacyl-ACP dehydratase [Pseudomonas oryzihabitans]|uniref:ApeP family dehydratase n=1 Tax=Pseudomonas oryzihabitans TaxID=47885 RepID=UPI00258F5F1F|nr:3-hydroxylacyl-ACP dehydratase [uncultured Pseudomonas sp.]
MIPWTLAELVPHAGDMLLIDEILACDESGIETRLVVRPGLFTDAAGALPAWIGVELMAQSVAAFAGCQARRRGEAPALGFLLGTRQFACDVPAFPAGGELRIRAQPALENDDGMAIFDCHLQGHGCQASARLNVYRPPQVDLYLEEPAP